MSQRSLFSHSFGNILFEAIRRSGKSNEPGGGFRQRVVLGLVVGRVGFIAGRAHHHDYEGGMRSGGSFGTHRRAARRLAQVGSGMENC
jgi:hypothetical protein